MDHPFCTEHLLQPRVPLDTREFRITGDTALRGFLICQFDNKPIPVFFPTYAQIQEATESWQNRPNQVD